MVFFVTHLNKLILTISKSLFSYIQQKCYKISSNKLFLIDYCNINTPVLSLYKLFFCFIKSTFPAEKYIAVCPPLL